MNKTRWGFLLALGLLVIALTGGTWTSNQFVYKPSLGARGSNEKNLFDAGMDRIDTRLSKEIWVGDPAYGETLPAAVAAIGGTKQVILRIPPGTQNFAADFSIPANITIKPERGTIFSIATGATLTINGQIEAGPYQIFSWTGTGKVVIAGTIAGGLYPQWWGVQGDGVTDNQAALQACLNAPTAANKIRFPQGTYLTNAQINWTPASNGLALVGKGMTKSIIRCTQPGTTVNKILEILNATVSDLTFEGLSIQGGPAYANRPNIALGIDNSILTRVTLKGVEFTQLRKGFWWPDSSATINYLTVEDCWFHALDNQGHDDYGICCYIGYGDHTLFRRCTFEDLSDSTTLRKPALYWYGGNYGKVQNCFFSGTNARLNFGVSDVGMVLAGNKIYDFEFSGNVMVNVNRSALTDAKRAILSNNIFINSSLYIARSEQVIVSGNNFQGNPTNSVFDAGATLPQLLVMDTGTVGEYATDGVEISQNKFLATGSNALQILGGVTGDVKNLTIQGNHLETTDTSYPVQLYPRGTAGTGIRLLDNYLKSLGSGIQLLGLNSGAIIGNSFEVGGSYVGIANTGVFTSAVLAAITVKDNKLISGSSLTNYQISSNPDWFNQIPVWAMTNVGNIVWNTNVQAGRAPFWICTNKKDTTISTQANAGATSISVASTSQMAAGDTVQIVLDNSSILLTTVSSVTDGTTVVIGNAIPASRSAPVGNAFFTNRWAVGGQSGYRTHAGAPNETPNFIGENLLDTTNGKWYKSKGTTTGDWVALN